MLLRHINHISLASAKSQLQIIEAKVPRRKTLRVNGELEADHVTNDLVISQAACPNVEHR